MNQQVKPSTQEAPQAATPPPPEITSLGSQEVVEASIGEIPPAPTVEVKSDNQPIETFAEETPLPSPTAGASADNLLTNPLELVIEQPLAQTPNPTTVSAELRAVQEMLHSSEFVGVERVIIVNRQKNTKDISLS